MTSQIAASLPRVRFYHGDLSMEFEAKLHPTIACFALSALAGLGYHIKRTPHLSPRCKMALLAPVPAVLLAAPFVELAFYEPRTIMTMFNVAGLMSLGFFRWIELLCDTGPEGFDKNKKTFTTYFCSPSDIVFDVDGVMKKPQSSVMGPIIRSFAVHSAVALIVLGVGRETGFSPFLGVGVDPTSLSIWGLPWSLPAIYLQVLWLYCNMVQSQCVSRASSTLLGIRTIEPMNSPLWASTSVRDFWGRRWNLTVHGMMKRSFFTPLRQQGWPRSGAFVAFIMSGLFHEIIWAAVNYPRNPNFIPGTTLVFFAMQFALTAAEAALEKTPIGRLVGSLPSAMRTAILLLVVGPSVALFLAPIQIAMIDAASWGHGMELIWDGSGPLVQYEWRRPPIDWFIIAFIGCAALCQAASRKIRGEPSGEAKKAQ